MKNLSNNGDDGHERSSRTRPAARNALQGLQAGLAIFNDGWSTYSCLIREMSEQGAKLSISPQSTLPEHFQLMIVNDKIIIPVECAWRRGDKVGVKFGASSRRAAPGGSKRATPARRSA